MERKEEALASNLERLQAAGVASKTPIREPYASVIEELSEEEVAALISVKSRFAGKSEVEAHGADMEEPAQEFFALF
jgi:hypothetical protein